MSEAESAKTIFKHALSFKRDPSLELLFQEIAKPDAKVNIVCGAGVTIDSGLPDWRGLVRRLAETIPHENIRDELLSDEITLTRKADYIFSLLPQYADHADAVAHALYGDSPSKTAGQLASAIAALCAVLGARARIVTTNYDDRLEIALGSTTDTRPASPVGLDVKEDWLANSFSREQNKILHIHGFLSSTSKQRIEPIVLSDSDYLAFGATVQDFIYEVVSAPGTTTLFLGLSMTDPSIVGPLSKAVENKCSNKFFTVITPSSRVQHEEEVPGKSAFAYCVSQGRYLLEHLGVNAIVLKTYGQIAQLVVELFASLESNTDYFLDDANTSLRYGHRFGRVARHLHNHLGTAGGIIAPSGDDSVRLSNALDAAMSADGGPVKFIEDFVSEQSLQFFTSEGISEEGIKSAHYELFLWLREVANTSDEQVRFRIFCLGSSAYTYRDGASLRNKTSYVSSGSNFAAAKACFLGRGINQVLDDGPLYTNAPWKSFVASPLTCNESDFAIGKKSIYPVSVGSVVLQTNLTTHERRQLKEALKSNTKVRSSPISLMDAAQLETLHQKVTRAGVEALRSAMNR